jgi:hypothetical protein
MAHVLPTATASIMGSLPREKAGVGSAVNDTTRQMGGAVGVALLGSIMASRYGDHVTSSLAGSGAEPSLVAKVSNSIQDGVATGRATGGQLGERIVTASHDAFLSGMHVAVAVAALITLAAAAAVFRWLPAQADAPAAAPEPVVGDDAGEELEPALAS